MWQVQQLCTLPKLTDLRRCAERGQEVIYHHATIAGTLSGQVRRMGNSPCFIVKAVYRCSVLQVKNFPCKKPVSLRCSHERHDAVFALSHLSSTGVYYKAPKTLALPNWKSDVLNQFHIAWSHGFLSYPQTGFFQIFFFFQFPNF